MPNLFMTESAFLKTKDELRRSHMWLHMDEFVESGLTPEEVSQQIFHLTGNDGKNGKPVKQGIFIAPGRLEPFMAKIRRRIQRERGPLDLDADGTIADFERDDLGLKIARAQGVSAGSTTDLYKLITQRV